MSSARESILASVRNSLRKAREEVASERRGETLPAPGDPEGLDGAAGRLERFRTVLEGVGGRCRVVRDEAEAIAAFAEIARELGAKRVAASDAPLARRLAASLDESTELLEDVADRAGLLEVDLGVTTAQWGIAETGTLVLESDAERHRLASLVPPVHVAVLHTDRIVGTLGEALAKVSAGGGSAMSRAITFITGPSRTADIELTLVVGVHGPRELFVLIVQDG